MDERLEAIAEGEDLVGQPGDPNGLRTVVIHRGEKGYGLTVSGESPVAVQDVKDGGPAAQAGVKKGDSIIRVNGTLVSQVNHKEVVQIIKCSTQFVKLTLRSCPEGELPSSLGSPQDPTHRPLPPTPTNKTNERITAPLPVTSQLQNQLEMQRVKMLHMYLDKQRKVRDSILVELERCPSKNLQRNFEKELDSINRQIAKITEELKIVKDIEGQLHTYPRSSPRSPPLSRSSFSHPHSHSFSHSRTSSDVPPPLPVRNRSLVSQISTPNISLPSSVSIPSNPNLSSSSLSGGGGASAAAPPLPPRPHQFERLGDGGLAQSLENIHKVHSINHSGSTADSSTRPPSHYRAKSSPDPLGQQASPGAVRLSDSLSDLTSVGSMSSGSRSKVSSIIGDETAIGEPPGTPPPPYASAASSCTSSLLKLPSSQEEGDENYSIIQEDAGTPTNPLLSPGLWNPQSSSIMCMEDDEFSDPEPMEDHGPFQSLSKLCKHKAYLAVFINYVISNCDSSSLFFYLITDLYKEGIGKEMKRWAYEIHSSFLLPGAPLRLSNIDENVLREIDQTLQHESDKEEILRKVFWKARQRSREDLNELLADFRSKRNAGLGSIFGPPDHHLEESIHNKTKELNIVDHLLAPCLESVSDDLKNATDQMFVMASSLATILYKYFNVRSQQTQNLIDRCPLFVGKERPIRPKIFRGNKKTIMFCDHHFNVQSYYSVTYCNHCGLIIWGIAPQGYQCTNCEMNIHKMCAKRVEEVCIGQLRKKDSKLSSFLGKIMPDDKENRRKTSQVNPSHIERARRGPEEGEIWGPMTDSDILTGEKGSGSVGSGKEQRRSDPGSVVLPNHNNNLTSSTAGALPAASCTSSASCASTASSSSATAAATTAGGTGVAGSTSEGGVTYDTADNPNSPESSSPLVGSTESPPLGSHGKNLHKKKAGNPINRSESCKEKQNARKRTRENRKHSDPNIPTSKAGDVDGDPGHLYTNSGSSSNSSLSQSQESPSTSLEQVPRPDAPLPNTYLEHDSDIEADLDLPDWQKAVPHDQIKRLKPKERKRQDTINELFHTERTHVRVLKVLKHLFRTPMLEVGFLNTEYMDMLFPNLDQVLEVHAAFNNSMKQLRNSESLVGCVGDLLLSMFDGEAGERFQQVAADFIKCQGIALEHLKQRQKKDQRLANFLQEQENHQACRRLQLKDMLPAGFQRLSKYPLLLESLQAYTDAKAQPEEYDKIGRALERSREILAFVNAAVQEAENHHRLLEIQKKLDQSSLTKNKGASEELRGNLDLSKHKLIYEGPLTWRISKGQKNIDLHVLLLDDFIVLLQKADDKYILKNHSINISVGKEDTKFTHSPIIKYGPSTLFRAVATDKCAFFLVTTQAVGAQIYELVAISANERKVWFRHIQEAQETYSQRDGRNRRPHPPPPLPDPEEPPPPPSDTLRNNVDDNVDGDVEGDASESATSTGTASSSSAVATSSSSKSDQSITKPGEATVATSSISATTTSSTSSASPSAMAGVGQPPASPESLAKKAECLRRKDVQIRTALDDKQRLIADILHIPYEHFESVADIAGEPGANKEPRELVLAAIFQAKYLQEILNETLTLRESDIVAAGANDGAGKANLPLYQAPMNKLLSISTALSEQLSALLNAVSERDDERERMRKELVASRERLHLLHMRQNQTPPSVAPATSPHTSRPSSFVSVGSSTAEQSDVADHHDTDEEISLKQQSSSKKDDGCDDLKDDSNPEMFLDAMSSELSEGTKEGSREGEALSSGKEGEESTVSPSEVEVTTGEVSAIVPAESEQADVSTT